MNLTRVKPGDDLPLDDAAAARPDGLPDDAELEAATKKLAKEAATLQQALYAEGERAVLVVFQGRDAGGKDGVIKRVFTPMNAQGTYVSSFRAPNAEELAHDYLWRIHKAMPERGHIGIFNRSHYEDVLVVRVEGLVPEAVWTRRYRQINHFERMLAESGTRILKFFLHVSRDEQKRRLLARLDNPRKNWKFDAGDLKVRAKWDEYTEAYRDALRRCSTPWGPWYVVPADNKRVRDFVVARTLVGALRRMDPQYPPADPDVLAWRDKIV